MSAGRLWLILTLLASTLASDSPHGSPAVSWGDWVILDEAEPGTSILLRRITPKSVFVAPTFNSCSEGYRQDSLGRCVKSVKVNQQAQWNFFLERLNSMYAPASSSENPQKEAGPFHINLPIGGGSQESTAIKRVPITVRGESVQSTTTTSTSTSTTPPPPTTTTIVSTMEESTTPEVTQPTMVDTSEVTSEKEVNFLLESTTEKREATAESLLDAVMLGDQPVTTEDIPAESLETPKNPKENTPQLPEKPFVIIVTNEPTTRTEETVPTTSFTSTTEEGEDVGVSSTTEVTTDGTTETTLRYVAESTPKTTDYDESFSETRDSTETSIRPTGKYITSTVRPKCVQVSQVDDFDPSDCEPETETISGEREVTNPVSLPANLPLLEPNVHVRFPSESFVPVRKTQSFVRFPDAGSPHDDRPSFWWPSWQFRQHPGIRGWPPSEESHPDTQQAIHKYPVYSQPPHSWADSTAWRRRFFQRD